jgi:hypothetical protein
LEAVGRKISASGLAQGQVQRGAHSLTPAALSLSAFGAAAAKYLPHPPRALIVSAPIARCKIKKNTLRAEIPALQFSQQSRGQETNLFVVLYINCNFLARVKTPTGNENRHWRFFLFPI